MPEPKPLDAAKVDLLLASLEGGTWRTRKATAKTLVVAFRSGRLDTSQRLRILMARDLITDRHDDHKEHIDNTNCSVDPRVDETNHEDNGVGVKFPL